MNLTGGLGARGWLGAVAWSATAVLSGAVAWEDLEVRELTLLGVLLDVLVGLVLCSFALLTAAAPRRHRVLLWTVGIAWLSASLLPTATLHQALLLIVLASYPSGTVRGGRGLLWLVLAVVVWSGLGGQVLAGLAFLTVAGLSHRWGRAPRWYPVTAGLSVGGVLLGSGLISLWRPASVDPVLLLHVYELVLIGTAVAYPFGVRDSSAAGARAVRAALRDDGDQPVSRRLHALVVALGEAVGDPHLEVVLLDRPTGRYLDAGGVDRTASLNESWLPVSAHGAPVARVRTTSGAVLDAAAWEALRTSVALVEESLRLEAERRARLAELRRARSRIIESVDLQRDLLARQLESSVVPPLRGAQEALGELGASGTPAEADIGIACEELSGALVEMSAVVRGAPPVALGEGRLVGVLDELARRTPAPVTVEVDGGFSGDPQAETTCYYACAEAMTNAFKHAGATAVRIRLSLEGRHLRLVVSDDGRGGADPAGTGLAGLRERVVAAGGRLEVRSAQGSGTVVEVVLPARHDQSMRDHGLTTSW